MIEYLNPQGINTWINPLTVDGQLIHSVNCYNPGQGILAKRSGYGTFLGTLGSQINNLFSMPFQNDSTLYLYAAAGSILSYSAQGTGQWTTAGNGTISNGQHVGNAILSGTMIVGDGIGSTKHTSNGTSFTNTTLAPVAQYLTQFHNRIYAASGTDSTLTYSSYGSADNWNIAVPADSSSFTVPDEGAISKMFVAGDRLMITKNKGKIFNWDDYSLVDTSNRNTGPSSPWSVASIDDTHFYLNQVGIFQHTGAQKDLISNSIQNFFYNNQNTGIGTASWGTAPAETYLWDYLVAIGNVQDPFVGRTINNAIIKYDFIKNQYHTWSFNDPVTAFHSYTDVSKRRQLIFGGTAGQCFQLDLTKTSDNGAPISAEAVFLFTYAAQQSVFSPTSASAISGSTYEKRWKFWRGFFNPGDECSIQFAFSNTLQYTHLTWSEIIPMKQRIGDYWQVSDGVCEIRFPNDQNNLPRSRFLFIRIYDDSDNSSWRYYGAQIDAEIQVIN